MMTRATGIVRNVDDLGRVVIPKEIRRSMKIHEGDPLEIYVDHENNSVIFQKCVTTTPVSDIEELKNSVLRNEAIMSNLSDDEKIILEYHFDNIYKILKGE